MAELVGRQASATWAGGEAGTIGTTSFGFVTRETLTLETPNVTRWGDVHSRYAAGINDATVTLGFWLESAFVPTIPTGTAAVLVVFIDTTGVQKMTYTNAIVSAIQRSSDARGGAQLMEITFKVTATGNPGTQPGIGAAS